MTISVNLINTIITARYYSHKITSLIIGYCILVILFRI
nr:MAG TPA: hypothetical protein [Inoviridae sp.]